MKHHLQKPESFLLILAFAGSLAWASWQTLLNNFAVERANFTGVEIGILHSLREIPGFLAFTTVFLLLLMREQTFALGSVLLLAAGVAITGFFPGELGLYLTTILMSVGFHYYFTVQKSLTLQWVEKERTPQALGQQSAARSYAAILVFAGIWLTMEWLKLDYVWIYLITGGAAVVLVLIAWKAFPQFPHKVPQRKHLLMRRRYWLYYALTFMAGSRRQIFTVFAGFLMVEKFGFSAGDIALLFLANHIINTYAAPRIGKVVSRFGERSALAFEYIGLIGIFTAYAFVDTAWIAAALYVADHLFFALAIAIESYFQKIADPADIASTAGVSFTINHIAAVFIPVVFGFIWIHSHSAVFLMGAGMAFGSLLLAFLVPRDPGEGNETVVGGSNPAPVASEAR